MNVRNGCSKGVNTLNDSGRTVYIEDKDEDNRLYNLFARSRYLTFRAREKELRRYHISPEQAQLLAVAQALDKKATPSEISRYTIRQPSTVSALIARMVKKGLVRKAHGLERKNWARVVLTKQGREAYELSAKRGPIHRILGSLTKQERKTFSDCLEKISVKATQELGMDREAFPPSD
jgi:DNA-binding MarR family transcriptional regulator